MNNPKIAVIIQMYWADLWPEFAGYLKNIKQPYDLYITLTMGSFTDNTLIKTYRAIRKFKDDTVILFTENRGLDIGSTFQQMKYILNNSKHYDYYLKIHGKKSIDTIEAIGAGKGAEWRNELIQPICGSEKAVNNCINLLRLSYVGMVGAEKWRKSANKNSVYLMKHSDIIAQYIKKLGMDGVTPTDCEFIGGTMFWVRGDVWESLFESLNIDNEYKCFETGKYNDNNRPSYAHAMERVFGLVVKYNNLQIIGL